MLILEDPMIDPNLHDPMDYEVVDLGEDDEPFWTIVHGSVLAYMPLTEGHLTEEALCEAEPLARKILHA